MPQRSAGNTAGSSGPAPDRRGLLKAGLAISSLPAMAALPSIALAAEPAIRFYKVMHDRYAPAAIAYGRAAAAAGHQTQAVDGDLTALWYELNNRWKRGGPIAIAGLTTPAAAMCLEMMAWDAGMRTLYRADHKPTADGGVQHVVHAPEPMLARAALLDTGAAWGHGAARLLNACPAQRSAKSTVTLNGAPGPGPALSEPLVSWVVAPVIRA